LTIRQFGERLYHDVAKVIAQYLETTAETAIVPAFINSSSTSESSSTADAGASFLKTVKRVWDDYTTAVDLILQVLYYLVKKKEKYKGVYNTQFCLTLCNRMKDYQNIIYLVFMTWDSTHFVTK
jgi:cullin 3